MGYSVAVDFSTVSKQYVYQSLDLNSLNSDSTSNNDYSLIKTFKCATQDLPWILKNMHKGKNQKFYHCYPPSPLSVNAFRLDDSFKRLLDLARLYFSSSIEEKTDIFCKNLLDGIENCFLLCNSSYWYKEFITNKEIKYIKNQIKIIKDMMLEKQKVTTEIEFKIAILVNSSKKIFARHLFQLKLTQTYGCGRFGSPKVTIARFCDRCKKNEFTNKEALEELKKIDFYYYSQNSIKAIVNLFYNNLIRSPYQYMLYVHKIFNCNNNEKSVLKNKFQLPVSTYTILSFLGVDCQNMKMPNLPRKKNASVKNKLILEP